MGTPLVLVTRDPGLRARLRHRAAGLLRPDLDGPGPRAVLASLQRGLEELGEPYRVDPPSWRGASTVGVLSDPEALRAAIAWRAGDPSRRLLAGPNLVVLPSDAPDLLTAPEVDRVLVPSDWVRDLYEQDMPQLRGRVAVWPAGIDPARWKPETQRPPARHALLYRKVVNGQVEAIDAAIAEADAALQAAGFTTETLTYGSFGPDGFRAALARTTVLVFFSPTESQCLALAEAWACDVPALVWNRARFEYRGRVYSGSSAPYLTPVNGRLFDDATDLAQLLADWDALAAGLHPRAWVLENMTDARSATAYLDLARQR
jgi:glycosyltransferase involved in cell wall biosynthesis